MADLVSRWRGDLEPTLHADPHLGLIGTLFNRCLDLFVALVKVPARDVLGPEELHILRVQTQKFNLWGSGFDAADGGLDSTLVYSSHIRKAVVSTLSSTGAALSELAKCFLHFEETHTPTTHIQSSALLDICKQMAVLQEQAAEVAGDYDVAYEMAEMNISGSETSSVYGVDDLVEDIKTYVDCLMDMVSTIEHPAKDPQNAEDVQVGGNNLGLVTDPSYSYTFSILHTFPSAGMEFVKRLGKANWERHERLRKKFALAISFKKEPEIPENDMGTLSDEESHLPSSHVLSKTTKSTFAESSLWDIEPGRQHNSQPEADTILGRTGTPASVTSFASSIIGNEGANSKRSVPRLPPEHEWGSDFSCPICGDHLNDVNHRMDWA